MTTTHPHIISTRIINEGCTRLLPREAPTLAANHKDKRPLHEKSFPHPRRRMVAAYPVGYFLDGSNGIPVCATPTQTGCQATWNSVAPEAPSFEDTSKSICVNPLNWKNDGTRADFSFFHMDLRKNAQARVAAFVNP